MKNADQDKLTRSDLLSIAAIVIALVAALMQLGDYLHSRQLYSRELSGQRIRLIETAYDVIKLNPAWPNNPDGSRRAGPLPPLTPESRSNWVGAARVLLRSEMDNQALLRNPYYLKLWRNAQIALYLSEKYIASPDDRLFVEQMKTVGQLAELTESLYLEIREDLK